ncbi:hypothetical protein FOPG_05117 [Fusarium oxysporum f. sp. conglutinans race 2 54008]|uniref:Uncharacterized protein n=1 Tax=Fusarium oxysporum f. sp. conglutinans race 2 54008 TaxID=1089457 RepID=X0ID34_FUSOX|nr:hypothetical protein FOPG_05117 [Fusarium oxysporum f. sp. conglutinans race 2 54008]
MASISAYQHTIPEVESERKNDHGDSYNNVNWTTATAPNHSAHRSQKPSKRILGLN